VKLWMKIFAVTLVIFIIISHFSIFLISRLYYENSLNMARSQAFTQHELMSIDISESLKAIIERKDEQNFHIALDSLMNYYFGYYEKKGIYLGIEKQGEMLSGNIPGQQPIQLKDVSDSRKSAVITAQSKKYIFISGKIADDYVLVYAQDITYLINSQNRLTKQLLLIGISTAMVFSIILFFTIKRLTSPIIKLQRVSKRIAEGEFTFRAKVKGADEIADLSESFNEMADKIVTKIEESEQLALQKQQFIDNLAHELKTPLTAIRGHAELLQSVKSTEDERLSSTVHIIQNIDRIQTMSQRLLELALNRDFKLKAQAVPAAELTEIVRAEFVSVLSEKGITLTAECQTDTVYGDPVLLQNLLCNLIDNSIKASENGGTVHLKIYEDNGHAVVEIADDGTGIAKEELENIFEPFYRTDFSRSNRSKGSAGLGLALCKQIADIHDARIEIESEQGKGASIKIIFTT